MFGNRRPRHDWGAATAAGRELAAIVARVRAAVSTLSSGSLLVERTAAGRDSWVYAAKVVGVAAAYYGSAKLGLSLAFESASVTAVWPPTGIALAAVVLWGFRVWPGVALGALLANAWTGVPLYAVLGITVGNTLEALTGAYLLRRIGGFRPSLGRVRDVIALALLAGALSTAISATLGVTSLLVADGISASQFGSLWRTWWLHGDLVVAPALLVAATHWPFNRAPGRRLEAAVLASVLLVVSLLVFSTSTPLIYLIYPPLIWAAWRFWQPGAVAASLIVAGVAVPFTDNGMGPFAANPPDERLLLAQTLVGIAGITALLFAAGSEQLGRLARERQRIVAEALTAEDRTRERISQRLHDEALQSLLAARQDLAEAAARPDRRELLAKAHERTQQAIRDLRAAVRDLHPVLLELGLAPAVTAAAQQHAERGGFQVEVDVAPDSDADPERSRLILSLVRELVANIARHADARHAGVSVRPRAGELWLEVWDDGRGIELSRTAEALSNGHIGLASAAQRVEALGGAFQLDSAAGSGTTVRATIPVRADGQSRWDHQAAPREA